MPKEDNSILKYNHREKSMSALFIIFADAESFLEKIDTCYSNCKKSSAAKINNHIACGYSFFMPHSFDTTKNKHN